MGQKLSKKAISEADMGGWEFQVAFEDLNDGVILDSFYVDLAEAASRLHNSNYEPVKVDGTDCTLVVYLTKHNLESAFDVEYDRFTPIHDNEGTKDPQNKLPVEVVKAFHAELKRWRW